MDALRNPYTPGAGNPPPALTGRDPELEQFALLLGRLELGRPEQSLLITGLRGVGKTVLLDAFEGIAIERGWFATSTEITSETRLAKVIATMTREALFDLRRMNESAKGLGEQGLTHADDGACAGDVPDRLASLALDLAHCACSRADREARDRRAGCARSTTRRGRDDGRRGSHRTSLELLPAAVADGAAHHSRVVASLDELLADLSFLGHAQEEPRDRDDSYE